MCVFHFFLIPRAPRELYRFCGSPQHRFQEALDAMASKVEAARDKWEVESYVVQQRNKEMLMEFGLSHVAI